MGGKEISPAERCPRNASTSQVPWQPACRPRRLAVCLGPRRIPRGGGVSRHQGPLWDTEAKQDGSVPQRGLVRPSIRGDHGACVLAEAPTQSLRLTPTPPMGGRTWPGGRGGYGREGQRHARSASGDLVTLLMPSMQCKDLPFMPLPINRSGYW